MTSCGSDRADMSDEAGGLGEGDEDDFDDEEEQPAGSDNAVISARQAAEPPLSELCPLDAISPSSVAK